MVFKLIVGQVRNEHVDQCVYIMKLKFSSCCGQLG